MEIIKQQISKSLRYSREDGGFYHKLARGRATKGKRAGSVMTNGYIEVGCNGNRYYEHRLVWLFERGKIQKGMEIDHVDGNRANNHISNLRQVTHSRNLLNTDRVNHEMYGICFDKARGKYKVRLAISQKSKFLGRFEDINEAKKVRDRHLSLRDSNQAKGGSGGKKLKKLK